MKIVVITPRFPYPLEKGDKLRLYHQLKYLSKKNEIVLLALADEIVSEASVQHIRQFCKTIHIFPIKKSTALWNAVKALLQKKPLEVGYFFCKKTEQKIHQIIDAEQPDHIYCQLIRVSEYVRKLPFPKTIDYMDAFSLGMLRRAENSPWFLKSVLKRDAAQLAEYEASVYADFDHHTIISEQDREYFKFSNKEQIHVLPNGVDTDFFAPQKEIAKDFDLAFVGNMGYYPNVKAAIFLAKKIMPLLQKENSGIRLLIAGARPTLEVKNLENDNIKITGWIDDIREAYSSAKIFVAPIFWGRGQQNKILEAMALGIPCITTTQVNNAIGAEEGKAILLADSAESWAKQISLLLENSSLQKQMSEAGLKFILEKFSWEKYGQQLEEILKM